MRAQCAYVRVAGNTGDFLERVWDEHAADSAEDVLITAGRLAADPLSASRAYPSVTCLREALVRLAGCARNAIEGRWVLLAHMRTASVLVGDDVDTDAPGEPDSLLSVLDALPREARARFGDWLWASRCLWAARRGRDPESLARAEEALSGVAAKVTTREAVLLRLEYADIVSELILRSDASIETLSPTTRFGRAWSAESLSTRSPSLLSMEGSTARGPVTHPNGWAPRDVAKWLGKHVMRVANLALGPEIAGNPGSIVRYRHLWGRRRSGQAFDGFLPSAARVLREGCSSDYAAALCVGIDLMYGQQKGVDPYVLGVQAARLAIGGSDYAIARYSRAVGHCLYRAFHYRSDLAEEGKQYLLSLGQRLYGMDRPVVAWIYCLSPDYQTNGSDHRFILDMGSACQLAEVTGLQRDLSSDEIRETVAGQSSGSRLAAVMAERWFAPEAWNALGTFAVDHADSARALNAAYQFYAWAAQIARLLGAPSTKYQFNSVNALGYLLEGPCAEVPEERVIEAFRFLESRDAAEYFPSFRMHLCGRLFEYVRGHEDELTQGVRDAVGRAVAREWVADVLPGIRR